MGQSEEASKSGQLAFEMHLQLSFGHAKGNGHGAHHSHIFSPKENKKKEHHDHIVHNYLQGPVPILVHVGTITSKICLQPALQGPVRKLV